MPRSAVPKEKVSLTVSVPPAQPVTQKRRLRTSTPSKRPPAPKPPLSRQTKRAPRLSQASSHGANIYAVAAQKAMAACSRFRAITINPALCGNADGVPDGDRTLSESFKSHTDQRISAVAFASSGTLAVWGVTVHPGPRGLYSYITAISGSTSSSTLTWTLANDDNIVAIDSKFIATRMIASRVRVFPTATLSTMNGRWIVMRWPKGYNSVTPGGECGPSTLLNVFDQVYAKRGTSNDPDQEGVTDFFVGSRPSTSTGPSSAGPSYGWINTSTTCDLNEGFSLIWVGVASAGVVQNDMGFNFTVDAAYEGALSSTNLIENPNSNDGDPSLFAAMLETLEAERNAASIYFDANSALIKSTLRMRTLMPVPSPAIADWAEPAMYLARLRAVLPHLASIPRSVPPLSPEDLEALTQLLRTLHRHAQAADPEPSLALAPPATCPLLPIPTPSSTVLSGRHPGSWGVV
jgi:hypothetical protein